MGGPDPYVSVNEMNKYKIWFRRLVWLGIAVNIYFSAMTIIVPDQLLSFLELPPTESPIWLSFSGNLLILLSLFYILPALDPDRFRAAAWLAIASRFAGVLFFTAYSLTRGESGYLLFGLADLAFAIPQFLLLYLGTREERSQAPLSADRRLSRRILIGALILVVAVSGSVFWFYLFREVPQSFSSIEDQFKYGSIGGEQEEGIPYWIWMILPRMFPEKLPGPGGYASLGIAWEEGAETPIGFSKKTIGFPRVAINCAFCHTATLREAPNADPRIFLGGPSHQFNPQAYQRFLFDCAADPRFTADNILAEMELVYELSFIERIIYRYAVIPFVRDGLLEQREAFEWTNRMPDWGHGRIDPFNPVKYRVLEQPFDGTIGNSDMVPIWNMAPREGMSLHWDGLSAVLQEVTRSSAIGDGATLKTIPLDDLDRLEAWFEQLPPPRYPFEVDEDLAARGRPIYEEECASCHAFGGERTGTVIPLDEVGTDRHRLDMWTQGSADAYNDYTAGYDWDFSGFVKTNGYVTPPDDAIWIRAPYLHNGSVPTLRDLLARPDQRPKAFYRGYDVFDPIAVGFISNVSEDGGVPLTQFDTTQPGNGNSGHIWGTDLSDDQKNALLEYLKTR